MNKHLNISKDFAAPKWEDWKQLVIDSLKGADYDKAMKTKTYDGITLQPIYRREDIRDLPFKQSEPGSAPYLRGNDPQQRIDEGWKVAQAQKEADLKKLNAVLKDELMRGLSMVNLKLKHDDDPEGLKLRSVKDLQTALDGIDLVAAPLFIQMDMDDEDIFLLLDEYISAQDGSVRDLEGCIGFDPSGELARKGYLSLPLEEVWKKVSDAVIQRSNRAPKLRCFIIDGAIYEAAGASSSQELGFVLSTAIGYIQGMMASGMDIDTVAPLFAVKLALGSNIFMEIAKIRAFRLLWAEMIKAFGGNESSQKVWIHGKTGHFNKSTYDLYVNMLRTTTESFSAVIGGVDSLEVEPFDALVQKDNPFARRMARNQQLILKEEAHLSKVVDPAGGCYYIESITAQFAEIAWSLMQKLESAGGMIRSLRAGTIHDVIAEVAQARIQAVHKRRDVVVGVNMFANTQDESLSLLDVNPDDSKAAVKLEKGAIPRLRAVASTEALRARISPHAPKIFFLNMGTVAEYKARADFAMGFFQMAGFEVLADQAFTTVEEAAKAAQESAAEAFCICSTDPNYESLVAPLCKMIQSKAMILAGYPADKVQQYKEDGIDIFIHIRANAYDTLKELAERLEVLK